MKIHELSSITVIFHYNYITIANSKVPLSISRVDIVLYSKNHRRYYYDDVTQSSLSRIQKVLVLKNNEYNT